MESPAASPGQRPDSPPALELSGFGVTRPGTDLDAVVPALRLGAGEAAALLGPSGCGKTSLLLALLGLGDPPDRGGLVTRGEARIGGEPMPAAGSPAWRTTLHDRVALVLQDARAALDPLLPVGAQIAQATGCNAAAIEGALADLGIEEPADLARRHAHAMSGGQAQRCLLAVALLRRPLLVIADEPTASLDEQRLEEVVARFALLRERTGTAILVATHDHALVDGLEATALVHQDGVFVRGDHAAAPWPRRAKGAGGSDGPLVECRGVGVRRGDRWVLRGADLTLAPGETLAIVGPSGAGKTTLALVVAGHAEADEGSVRRPARRGAVQMLFQNAFASLTPGHTVRQLVAEVAAPGFDIAASATRLGLPAECLERPGDRLSGGERRRAALLRALSVHPSVLVLDEPTASLDRATATPIIETLLDARPDAHTGTILVTHDLELAHAVADRIIRLENGRLQTAEELAS